MQYLWQKFGTRGEAISCNFLHCLLNTLNMIYRQIGLFSILRYTMPTASNSTHTYRSVIAKHESAYAITLNVKWLLLNIEICDMAISWLIGDLGVGIRLFPLVVLAPVYLNNLIVFFFKSYLFCLFVSLDFWDKTAFLNMI